MGESGAKGGKCGKWRKWGRTGETGGIWEPGVWLHNCIDERGQPGLLLCLYDSPFPLSINFHSPCILTFRAIFGPWYKCRLCVWNGLHTYTGSQTSAVFLSMDSCILGPALHHITASLLRKNCSLCNCNPPNSHPPSLS